jgi:hypothetical protein
MPGRVTEAGFPVAVLGQHLAAPGHQNRAEREVPRLDCFCGQLHAPAQMRQIIRGDARRAGARVLKMRHAGSFEMEAVDLQLV